MLDLYFTTPVIGSITNMSVSVELAVTLVILRFVNDPVAALKLE